MIKKTQTSNVYLRDSILGRGSETLSEVASQNLQVIKTALAG